MNQNVLKGLMVSGATVLTVYFANLFLPVVILICVMLGDYASGMIKAWITKSINSRTGIVGIIKKLCYLLVVSVGIVCDLIGSYALCDIGIEYFKGKYVFAIVVIIWLIVNELISILENLSQIGIPIPAFLLIITLKLKKSVNSKLSEKSKDNFK